MPIHTLDAFQENPSGIRVPHHLGYSATNISAQPSCNLVTKRVPGE